MLNQLYIENVAVIEKAIIDFKTGFNVFTGETGAGKSILIDALSAVLGFRSSKDIVRTGEKKAFVRAVFENINQSCKDKLKDNDIPFDENSPLILSREITNEGKTLCKINSFACTVSILKEIGLLLIDIHGQHDNQKLLNSENHLDYLDKFAKIENVLIDYKKDFKQMCRLISQINQLTKAENEKLNRIDKLKQIILDFEEVNITCEEELELLKEQKILQNSEDIAKTLTLCDSVFSGEENDGICERLSVLIKELSKIEPIVSVLKGVSSTLEDSLLKIQDSKDAISSCLSEMEYSPTRLFQIEERLDDYYKLKQKYSLETDELILLYNKSVKELDVIKTSHKQIENLKIEYEKLYNDVMIKAENISKFRKKAAIDFSEKIKNELYFLNMEKTEFVVSFEKSALSKKGLDKIEFLISANQGETPKPISKIASGGELSRIMLALKSILSSFDSVFTMIFDEIDTGISGKAAQKVGIKLKQTANKKQVICVTHLAQIASYGDNHLLIEKRTANEKTYTSIISLDYEKRLLELARIISGENITPATIQTAKDMIDSANK